MGKDKIITKTLPSVLLGGIICTICHFALLYIFFLDSNTEDENPEWLMFLLFLTIPAIIGSFTAVYFFKKSKLLNGLLSALLFTVCIILPEISFFTMGNDKGFISFIALVLASIIIGALAGSYGAISLKKIKD